MFVPDARKVIFSQGLSFCADQLLCLGMPHLICNALTNEKLAQLCMFLFLDDLDLFLKVTLKLLDIIIFNALCPTVLGNAFP